MRLKMSVILIWTPEHVFAHMGMAPFLSAIPVAELVNPIDT